MTFASTVLGLAPVGYWRLGEASGTTMTDSSGNAHDGTYNGGVTLGQPGLVDDTDTAALFDGSTGYGSVAAGAWQAFTSAMSCVAVVNLTSNTRWQVVTYMGDPLQLSVTATGQVRAEVYTDGPTLTVLGSTVPAGTPTLVGAVFDGASLTAYVGTAATQTAAGSAVTVTTTYADLTIGSFGPSSPGYEWGGVIDEVALFNTALTAADFSTLNASLSSAPPPTGTRLTYSGDGYNSDGSALVDFDPAVASAPAHLTRAKVQRVHQSLPAPTLVNGRPQ